MLLEDSGHDLQLGLEEHVGTGLSLSFPFVVRRHGDERVLEDGAEELIDQIVLVYVLVVLSIHVLHNVWVRDESDDLSSNVVCYHWVLGGVKYGQGRVEIFLNLVKLPNHVADHLLAFLHVLLLLGLELDCCSDKETLVARIVVDAFSHETFNRSLVAQVHIHGPADTNEHDDAEYLCE